MKKNSPTYYQRCKGHLAGFKDGGKFSASKMDTILTVWVAHADLVYGEEVVNFSADGLTREAACQRLWDTLDEFGLLGKK